MSRFITVTAVLLLCILVSSSALATSSASEQEPLVEGGLPRDTLMLDADLVSQLETRALFGLPSDPAFVESLNGSHDDAGTDLGYPLTSAERAYVDHIALFVTSTRQELLPAAESLPTFVDAYFDHSRAGLLVLQFTGPLTSEMKSLYELVPAEGPGTEVIIVEHSADHLYAAMHEAWNVWPKDNRDLLVSVSVDPKTNGLTLEVTEEASGLAVQIANKLEGIFDMDVGIELVLPNDEVVCTSRTNCHTPLRGGVQITAVVGSITRLCTMGFHVRISGDDQFVSAGHCGHNAAAATWRHASLGNIGVRTATQYQQNGRDIMRVQMSNSQDSSLLYSSSTAVTADLDPYLGEPVCAYKGVSTPVVHCAAITDNVTSWTGTECGCTITGGDTSLSSVGGDSGSPIVDQNSRWVAIGLLNTTSGLFARLDDALNQWGAVIRTP